MRYERSHRVETRVAIISIIVEAGTKADKLNGLLSEAAAYIIGRTGIPYRQKGINIICVAIDAPQDVINALSGNIGRLPHVTSKVMYSNVSTAADTDSQDETPC